MGQNVHLHITSLGEIDAATKLVGLPVGPRTGPNRRTKEKKEWYVALGFLKNAISAQIFDLPIAIRNGWPPEEPDFVVMREGTKDPIALVEITEATDEADQREMTTSELSEKSATFIGEFGGRFAGGASRPGLVWASDIAEAIKRKEGKVIFKDLPVARHLIVYPNSNASILLFDEEGELEAVRNLSGRIAEDSERLLQITNGCSVHVLGKYHVCIDVIGEMRILTIVAAM